MGSKCWNVFTKSRSLIILGSSSISEIYPRYENGVYAVECCSQIIHQNSARNRFSKTRAYSEINYISYIDDDKNPPSGNVEDTWYGGTYVKAES